MSEKSSRPFHLRAKRVVLAVLAAHIVLVATNLGEFWPFSIYPMFSQAGRPWSRAVVRELPTEGDVVWESYELEQLPGRPFPLRPAGIDPIDLAKFVTETKDWDTDRVRALKQVFHDQLEGRRLLVMRVNGELDEDEDVSLSFVPYVLLDETSGGQANPSLREETP